MRKLIPFFAVACLALAGCENMRHDNDRDNMRHDDMNKSNMNEPKRMSADACAHCPGVQTATADGRCPVCGAKVQ